MTKISMILTIATLVAMSLPAFGQETTIRIGPEPDGGGTTTPENAGVHTDEPASKGENDRKPVIVNNNTNTITNPVTERIVVERHTRKTTDAHIANVALGAVYPRVEQNFYNKHRSDAAHVALAEMLGSHAPAAGSAAVRAPEEGNMSGSLIALLVFLAFAIAAIAMAAINNGGGTRTATVTPTALGLLPRGRAITLPLNADEAIRGGCDLTEYDTEGVSYRRVVHHDPPQRFVPQPQPALPAPPAAAPAFVPYVPPSAKARSNATVNLTVVMPPRPKATKAATATSPGGGKATSATTPPPPAPKTPTPAPVPKPATPAAKAATTPPKPAATPAAPAKVGKATAGRKPART